MKGIIGWLFLGWCVLFALIVVSGCLLYLAQYGPDFGVQVRILNRYVRNKWRR